MIAADAEQLGVLTPREALTIAQEQGLDLVEVSPNADPPVCRIMDYGKYVYDLNKKEKEAKKKQHNVSLKEVKLGTKIDAHDFQTKLKHAEKFLSRGDKVKLTMFFRGRERAHAEHGKGVMSRFVAELEEFGTVEKNSGMERNVITIIMTPIKVKK